MTFRTRLLLISTFTITGSVALVTGAVSVFTRQSFQRIDEERRAALMAQFQRELALQGEEVARKVERAAASEAFLRVALEAGRPDPDLSLYVSEAKTQADALGLEFLDILKPDKAILSSAHWAARFGYRNDWLLDWEARAAFLARIPTQEGDAVALAAIRTVETTGRFYVIGARRLDKAFLDSLGLAPGMRVVLWLGPTKEEPLLDPLAQRAVASKQQVTAIIQRTADKTSREAFVALPLIRGGTVLGVLLAGTSLREQVLLEQSILRTGLVVGLSGILLGVLMGWWATERLTRPLEQLARGSRTIASGDWSARVPVTSRDEIGELAQAFNHMAGELTEQRERALQAERVAAWRELARRLAHELKNPLFPLQVTVENLQRARDRHPEQFEEVFRESTGTLLQELANLKRIIGRFSDFAKMPKPQFETVDVNEAVQEAARLFAAQTEASSIVVTFDMASDAGSIEADQEQLSRALRNLMLNAMDAMPKGGKLHISTRQHGGSVRIEVGDTGEGLTEEECARLFTPYYTTKQHGTGLGLAIVQSVVSDHKGKIAVVSQPGAGATFVIDLPVRRDA